MEWDCIDGDWGHEAFCGSNCSLCEFVEWPLVLEGWGDGWEVWGVDVELSNGWL